MKTLYEHNKDAIETHNIDPNQFRGNGILCPKCSSELYDSDPGQVLLSMPPQHRVKCSKCEYMGFRY
jgi:hypothetical protein